MGSPKSCRDISQTCFQSGGGVSDGCGIRLEVFYPQFAPCPPSDPEIQFTTFLLLALSAYTNAE